MKLVKHQQKWKMQMIEFKSHIECPLQHCWHIWWMKIWHQNNPVTKIVRIVKRNLLYKVSCKRNAKRTFHLCPNYPLFDFIVFLFLCLVLKYSVNILDKKTVAHVSIWNVPRFPLFIFIIFFIIFLNVYNVCACVCVNWNPLYSPSSRCYMRWYFFLNFFKFSLDTIFFTIWITHFHIPKFNIQ